jgi:hypothetical protein
MIPGTNPDDFILSAFIEGTEIHIKYIGQEKKITAFALFHKARKKERYLGKEDQKTSRCQLRHQ